MAAETEKVYLQSSLNKYPFGKRLQIVLADWAFFLLIKLIGGTVRFEVSGSEPLRAIADSGRLPIYAVWHDRIFLGTYYLQKKGIVFLTSQSFDGEYIARFLQRFGFGVIRGSSTRGGTRALVEMVRGMKAGLAMGFTVDGPKGPRYQVKPGIVMLARKSGNPVVPFIVTPRRFFTIGSWDRLQIPVPFSRALVTFGEPMEIDEEATIEAETERLQTVMDGMVRDAEEWRRN